MIRILKNVRKLSTAPMTAKELSVPVPWGEIRGKVWGPDHGRPVLCLHGWADNCGSFNALIPLLPKECRYVAVDLAGHGRSSHRPPGVFYAFPSYVADVQRVVDTLRWRRFSILGHSMGGNIAGMFSALFPEMVEACVLLDSYGFLPTDPKQLSKIMRRGMDDMLQFEKKPEKSERVYTYEKALERLLAANPSLSETSACHLLERGLLQVEGGVVFSRDFRINLKNVARITLEQSLELLSRIEAAVLVVLFSHFEITKGSEIFMMISLTLDASTIYKNLQYSRVFKYLFSSLADEGFEKMFAEPDQKKFTSELLQGYRHKNHSVVKVPGGHHVHLTNPESVAPPVSEFLRAKVLSSTVKADGLATKL